MRHGFGRDLDDFRPAARRGCGSGARRDDARRLRLRQPKRRRRRKTNCPRPSFARQRLRASPPTSTPPPDFVQQSRPAATGGGDPGLHLARRAARQAQERQGNRGDRRRPRIDRQAPRRVAGGLSAVAPRRSRRPPPKKRPNRSGSRPTPPARRRFRFAARFPAVVTVSAPAPQRRMADKGKIARCRNSTGCGACRLTSSSRSTSSRPRPAPPAPTSSISAWATPTSPRPSTSSTSWSRPSASRAPTAIPPPRAFPACAAPRPAITRADSA